MKDRVKNGEQMKKSAAMTAASKKRIIVYLLQLLLCLMPQAVVILLLLTNANSQFAFDLCFVLLPFIAVPLLALVLPYFCSKYGIHPLLTFFPAGFFMLVNLLYTESIYRLIALGCMAVSLISACAGAEKAKREKNGKTDRKKK